MRRLKPKVFKAFAVGLILCLAIGRGIYKMSLKEVGQASVACIAENDVPLEINEAEAETSAEPAQTAGEGTCNAQPLASPSERKTARNGRPHKIRSIGPSFRAAFPDLQDAHASAARHWGIRPVRNRQEVEERKGELVFVGSSPYYMIDKGMQHSIPYLVPRAADMLNLIATNFLDSLYMKGIPAHKIVLTSVLRTEEDVKRLARRNGNASKESCHRYGTTIDIAYNRYHTVCPPGEIRRVVGNDSLKWVLSEVLRDLRQENRCYIKYEVKQPCFHITTR